MSCACSYAVGETVYNKTTSVGASGTRVRIPLPRRPGGRSPWGLTIHNRATLSGGTDTNLFYGINQQGDPTSELAAMASGHGLYVGPDKAVEYMLPCDVDEVSLDLRGLQSDFSTAGEVAAHIAVFAMRPACSPEGRTGPEPCGG